MARSSAPELRGRARARKARAERGGRILNHLLNRAGETRRGLHRLTPKILPTILFKVT